MWRHPPECLRDPSRTEDDPGGAIRLQRAIARSQNDQLLLNLVRLRYREYSNVSRYWNRHRQYTLDARVGVLPRIHVDGTGSTEIGVDLGGRYSEQPTITYEPISGAEFTQRLLTPISPSTIILLSQSGWSVERLLMCCVDRLNDVTNAPVASGPTPSRIPDNSRFREVAPLAPRIADSGIAQLHARARPGDGSHSCQNRKAGSDSPRSNILRSLREILDLDAAESTFRLTTRSGEQRDSDEIVLTGRSLLGALFFLSHNVDPPDSHKSRGLVTVLKGQENEDFNWSIVSGNLLRSLPRSRRHLGRLSGSATAAIGSISTMRI